jgi:hypothetical protein
MDNFTFGQFSEMDQYDAREEFAREEQEQEDCEWGPHYGDFYDEDEYHHESAHPAPSDVMGWEDDHDFNWPSEHYE